MASVSLLSLSALHLLAAIFLAMTAWKVLKRDFTPDVRSAGSAFGLAWLMLAVMAGSDGLRILAAIAAESDVALYAAVVQIGVIATAVMIAGFGYYVLFLWTGKRWTLVPLVVYGVFHAAFYLYRIHLRTPAGIETSAWSTAMTFQGDPTQIASPITTYLTFYAPPVLLALLFLSLLFRFGHPGQRLRAVATAAVIIFYHGTHYLRFAPDFHLQPLANPFMAILLIISAVVAWFAHRVPVATETAAAAGPSENRAM